jgi:hypothetical protein
MKKFKEKQRTLCFDVFAKYEMRFVHTNDMKRSMEKRKIETDDFDEKGTGALTVENTAGHCWIFFNSNRPVTHNWIAHEAFHAVKAMLHFIGAEVAKDAHDEFVAYLIGYTVENICKSLGFRPVRAKTRTNKNRKVKR